MRGPHKHHCPIDKVEFDCPDPVNCKISHLFAMVCFEPHSREVLIDYIARVRRAHNDELREEAKEAQRAYSMGKYDGITESEEFR